MASEAALGRRYEATISTIQAELDEMLAKVGLEPVPFKVTGRNKKIARISTLQNIANVLAAVNGALPEQETVEGETETEKELESLSTAKSKGK